MREPRVLILFDQTDRRLRVDDIFKDSKYFELSFASPDTGLPDLKSHRCFYLYLESRERVYHITNTAYVKDKLEFKVGNSFLAPVKPRTLAAGAVYGFLPLSDLGMSQVNTGLLQALPETIIQQRAVGGV